jgi:hypothetical protein
MAASFLRQGSVQPLGAHSLQVMQVTLTDVTEADIPTAEHGFSNIIGAWFNNETTEGDGLLEKNYTVANAASIGNIALTGFTSGDVVTVFILGN